MKHIGIIILLIIAVFFSGCDNNSPASYSQSGQALGTNITARIDGMTRKKARTALNSAFMRLNEIEAITSAKRGDSELSHVNRNAFSEAVLVSDELFDLLEEGLYYSRLTGGAFDITLGSVVELWGIGSGSSHVPSGDEVAAAIENSGYEHMILGANERTVRFLKEGLRLDLGAIAKGYAADEMKRVLLGHGVTNAVLDLGGDIIIIGDNGGSGRRIGITNPQNPGKLCAVVRISDKTVVTSGDYERFFVRDGVRYHHIFDRRTGFPAAGGIISATIITESSMIADALSTALFVMGVDETLNFAISLEGIDYILIDSEMNYYYTEGIELEILE